MAPNGHTVKCCICILVLISEYILHTLERTNFRRPMVFNLLETKQIPQSKYWTLVLHSIHLSIADPSNLKATERLSLTTLHVFTEFHTLRNLWLQLHTHYGQQQQTTIFTGMKCHRHAPVIVVDKHPPPTNLPNPNQPAIQSDSTWWYLLSHRAATDAPRHAQPHAHNRG